MLNIDVNDPFVQELSESLVDEVVGAVGLHKNRFNHWLTWQLIRPVTDSFAKIGVTFERLITNEGLPAASRWVLSLFCHPVQAYFKEEILQEGPLLVAANHPGAYDSLVFFSQLERQDIRWISTEIPFLKLLPNTFQHSIVAPRNNSSSRMIALRNIMRHLKNGGTMVYFASGHRDPDMAVYPGAEKTIDTWLPVFDMFYKYIPDLKVVTAIGSGILSEKWAYHALTKLRRKQVDRHRLAEFGQVISQLIKPGRLMITPTVSFGSVLSREALQVAGANGKYQAMIQAHGKELLRDHARRFNRQFL